MAELTTPQQNRLLGQLANMLRTTEGDIAAPEFLPSGLDVMGLVRQLMLPSAETVEKLSYGDPLFRMPQQSYIPITADREYLADVVGMAPMVPAASSGATRLTNEAADALVRAITRNPEATAPGVLEAAGQMLPIPRITTYHGSPYLFREFDPARVGTGEGAQAYGVGAGYTAEARPVADGYRQAIKDMGTIKDINAQMAKLSDIMDEDAVYPGAYRKFKSDRGREAAEKYDQLMAKRNEVRTDPGYLYRGEIPDEVLPSFLDWDKPVSNQKNVMEMLRENAEARVKDRLLTEIQSEVARELPQRSAPSDNFLDVLFSPENEALSQQTRQLAQERLSKMDITDLVDKELDAIKPADSNWKLTGKQLYEHLAKINGSQEKATQILNEAGIRGIRYLDEGSRSRGQGTSNFIPFRAEDYRIQEINDRPVEEFFPGLLDEPAQSVAEAPKFEMPSFATMRPETEGDIDQIYDFVEQQAKKAGYRVKSGASNVSGSRYLTITEDLPGDDIRDIELRISDHGDRHPFSDTTEGKISIDPSRSGFDLEAALYELQDKGFNLLR